MDRYYYKDNNGNLFDLKTPVIDKNLIEITEQEYNNLLPPVRIVTAEERAKQAEIAEINEWFEKYDNQIKQLERCKRLGIEYDNKYGSQFDLDKTAEIKAARLLELRNLLK